MENQSKELSQLISSKLGWLESIQASKEKIAGLKAEIKAETVTQRRYARYVKNLRSTLEALGHDPMAGEEGMATDEQDETTTEE